RHPQRVDHQHRAQHSEQAEDEEAERGRQTRTAGHRIVTSFPRTSGPSIVHAAVSGPASGAPGGGTGVPGSPAAASWSSRRASRSEAALTVSPGPLSGADTPVHVDPARSGYRGQSCGPWGIGSANDGTAVMSKRPVENAAVPASPMGRMAYRVLMTPCGLRAVRSKTTPVSWTNRIAP